jgi:hypothetical protein
MERVKGIEPRAYSQIEFHNNSENSGSDDWQNPPFPTTFSRRSKFFYSKRNYSPLRSFCAHLSCPLVAARLSPEFSCLYYAN